MEMLPNETSSLWHGAGSHHDPQNQATTGNSTFSIYKDTLRYKEDNHTSPVTSKETNIKRNSMNKVHWNTYNADMIAVVKPVPDLHTSVHKN